MANTFPRIIADRAFKVKLRSFISFNQFIINHQITDWKSPSQLLENMQFCPKRCVCGGVFVCLCVIHQERKTTNKSPFHRHKQLFRVIVTANKNPYISINYFELMISKWNYYKNYFPSTEHQLIPVFEKLKTQGKTFFWINDKINLRSDISNICTIHSSYCEDMQMIVSLNKWILKT